MARGAAACAEILVARRVRHIFKISKRVQSLAEPIRRASANSVVQIECRIESCISLTNKTVRNLIDTPPEKNRRSDKAGMGAAADKPTARSNPTYIMNQI